MKLHRRLFSSVLFLLLSPMSANAVPITFTFDMPAFTGGSLSGSTAVLEVTADNGGSTDQNQTFLNTQVTNLSTNLTGPISTLRYGGIFDMITTDTQGIATINRFPDYAYVTANSGNFQITLAGYPFSPFYVQSDDGAIQRGKIENARTQIFPLLSRSSPIPEPGTLALLAAGIGFMYRRKAVGGRV